MKVISLRNHLRNYELDKIPTTVHPKQVDKGVVFEFGLETQTKIDHFKGEQKQLLCLLIHARALAPADAEVVKRVTEEVELEKKREANHAKAAKELGNQQTAVEVLAALTNAVRFNANAKA